MSMMENSKLYMRPQPLGVFPFPAGLLLLPDLGDAGRPALAKLMQGDANAALPAEWRFFELALGGDYDQALAAISGSDSIAIHNRIALGEDLPEDGVLQSAVRYAVGRDDKPPVPEGLDAELLAFVLMLHSIYWIERDQIEKSIEPLTKAIAAAREVSPEFAAQMLGQLAALQRERPSVAISHYHEALRLARGNARAELSLQLGMALQDGAEGNPTILLEAVNAYREALRHYAKEAFPEKWASAQMNLANALQSGSSYAEAVEIYDEILSVRNRTADPVGYARILANQAHAQAQLGMYAVAMEKAGEAYTLFRRHDEPGMAASALELRKSIAAVS